MYTSRICKHTCWSFEPGLKNVGVKESSGMCHVVDVKQTRTVGEDGVNVYILNVRQVGHCVFWQK